MAVSEPTFKEQPGQDDPATTDLSKKGDGDCPKLAAKQQRLKLKLQQKAALEKQRMEELSRKRQQALEFMAILQEDLIGGGSQGILDSIDSLFHVLDWEKQFFKEPQDPRKRLKDHLSYALPNYQQALKLAMEKQIADQAAAQEGGP